MRIWSALLLFYACLVAAPSTLSVPPEGGAVEERWNSNDKHPYNDSIADMREEHEELAQFGSTPLVDACRENDLDRVVEVVKRLRAGGKYKVKNEL